MSKFTRVDDRLHDYLVAHRSADDPLLVELRRETQVAAGPRSIMQVAPEQGSFMRLIVAAIGAKRVIEIGTFTGYSSLCMARGLPVDGQLITCDVSEEYTAVARRFWSKAGVADKIDLRIGPATDTLRAMPEEESFDFGFIDADKPNYPVYYEEILKRLRPGGLIAIDNVLWNGLVVNEEDQSESTVAIREINDRVAADTRVESVMIALSDGLTLARKLG